MPTKPILREGPNSLTLSYESEGINFSATQLAEERRQVIGELEINTTLPAIGPRLRNPKRFNFSSDQAISRLSTTLANRVNTQAPLEWEALVEDMAGRIVRFQRQGQPVQTWVTYGDAEEPAYLLHPFIVEDSFSVIFGDGGSGKSTLAKVLYLAASIPWVDNPLSLTPNAKGKTGLLLDWESGERQTKWDVACLLGGLGLSFETPFHYLLCFRPFDADIEHIRTAIQQVGAEFIIVDSLGAAVGDDLNATAPAFRFINALRSLKITCLAIGHTSKSPEGKKSLYGNAYYTNEARSVWELRCTKEDQDPDVLNIGLFHVKANSSRFFRPIGYRIIFGTSTTEIAPQDPRTIAEFLERMGLQTKILEALKVHQPVSSADLAVLLSANPQNVRSTLTRLQKRGQVRHLKVEGKWGLASAEWPSQTAPS